MGLFFKFGQAVPEIFEFLCSKLPSNCPYSYLFFKALEFYFKVFLPVSIFKIDLNVAEIRTSRLCMHQKLI